MEDSHGRVSLSSRPIREDVALLATSSLLSYIKLDPIKSPFMRVEND